jgi:calnexin
MNPPINPPETIDDPTDLKPEDWVDDKEIPDPESKKPDDWDESAPLMIYDPDDNMPDDWHEDAPLKILDPEASRPDDWDDEEDGIWEAPEIPNPLCEASGCGPWVRAKKQNPDYKGPWKPPMISNPLYIGEWKAKQIPNPSYFKHENPVEHLAPVDGVFLEVWTTNNAFHFDNFVFGHSLDDALTFAKETFDSKAEVEKEYVATKNKEAVDNARQKKLEKGGFMNMIEVYFAIFTDFIMEQNPIAVGATLFGLFIAAVFLIIKGSSNVTEEVVEQVTESQEDDSTEEVQDEKEDTPTPEELDEPEAEVKSKKSPKSTSKRRSRRTGD